jgi:hypothetical protein
MPVQQLFVVLAAHGAGVPSITIAWSCIFWREVEDRWRSPETGTAILAANHVSGWIS